MKQLPEEKEFKVVFTIIIPIDIYHSFLLLKRLMKNIVGTSNQTIYYINDNLVQVRNFSGVFNTTYYYANGVLLAENSSSGKRYYHPDHLGSTNLITNSTGSIVEETFYLPFGEVLDGGSESRYNYNSKEKDSTNLNYYGARYYKSKQGQFVQPDTVTQIYNPQNLNHYAYVLNNPYKYVDPNGLFAVSVGISPSGSTPSLLNGVGVYGSGSKKFYIVHDSSKDIFHGYSYGGSSISGTLATSIGPGSLSDSISFSYLPYVDSGQDIKKFEGISTSVGLSTKYFGGFGGELGISPNRVDEYSISFGPGIGAVGYAGVTGTLVSGLEKFSYSSNQNSKSHSSSAAYVFTPVEPRITYSSDSISHGDVFYNGAQYHGQDAYELTEQLGDYETQQKVNEYLDREYDYDERDNIGARND